MRFINVVHHLRWDYGEADCSDVADVESVRRAIKLVDYFKNHIRRATKNLTSAKQANVFGRLIAFIRNSPGRRVRPRNLIGNQIAPNADEAKALLQKLALMGLGEIVPGRRKDEVLCVGRDDFDAVAESFENP